VIADVVKINEDCEIDDEEFDKCWFLSFLFDG